jgi:hypothetical protein
MCLLFALRTKTSRQFIAVVIIFVSALVVIVNYATITVRQNLLRKFIIVHIIKEFAAFYGT